MEDWYSGSPYGLPGILQVDVNDLILWEKRGKIACLLFTFPPPTPTGFKKLR